MDPASDVPSKTRLCLNLWLYLRAFFLATFDGVFSTFHGHFFFEYGSVQGVESLCAGVIAGLFRQIGGHSSRFVLFCSF